MPVRRSVRQYSLSKGRMRQPWLIRLRHIKTLLWPGLWPSLRPGLGPGLGDAPRPAAITARTPRAAHLRNDPGQRNEPPLLIVTEN